MERSRDFQQCFANQKKEEPRRQNRETTLGQPRHSEERRTFCKRNLGQFFQAGGTHHAIRVLCHAFPAEKLFAFRAAGHRFAPDMVETAEVGERRHDSS